MSTVNISLPVEQVSFIDNLVSQYSFASRSELFRSLLRLVHRKPALLEEASVFPMKSPPKATVDEVMADFRKVGKYSKLFLKDLEEGLRNSQFYSK